MSASNSTQYLKQLSWTLIFCRLLRDLHTVEANLEFWQNRLHQGSHLSFMLFGQGPVSFAHDVLLTLERKHRQRMTSATDKIERRVGSLSLKVAKPCVMTYTDTFLPWHMRYSVQTVHDFRMMEAAQIAQASKAIALAGKLKSMLTPFLSGSGSCAAVPAIQAV